MDLATSVAISVPLLSGLIILAFKYPDLYRKHFQGPMFAAPWLVLVVFALLAIGFVWGSGTQYAIDKPSAGAATWFPIQPWFVLMSCGAWTAVAIALSYLAHISPHADHKP